MTLLFLALWLQMSAPNCEHIPIKVEDAHGNITVKQFQMCQRAADETDGKPPKCANGSNCYCGDTGCRDYTQAEWDEFNRIMAEPVEPYKPPEPVDVPAVQVPIQSSCMFLTSKAEWICTDHGTPDFPKGAFSDAMPGKGGYIETCADKSRVLLTSEDGKSIASSFE